MDVTWRIIDHELQLCRCAIAYIQELQAILDRRGVHSNI